MPTIDTDRLQPHLEAARNAKAEWSAASVALLKSDRKDRVAHESTVAHAEKTQAAFMHAAHVLTAELLKQTELAQ
ncbi:hypothetical protein [Pseudomonas sp. AB12(2023)]|uniref:hypothetical protein n=1 Tax=Pseudomonas sp. AB12(2023) TaxID=3048597 RepID=UPI002B221C3A|nr:hypothetical protein [Pseudomonas sp. AB12(2023)]MEB0222095.1 hypothetical protein [Pseudomonas sp. AB12(2023)]